jgi:hypothetical protein
MAFDFCSCFVDADVYTSRAKTVVMYTDARPNMGLGKTNWVMSLQVYLGGSWRTVGGSTRYGYVSQSSPSRRSMSIKNIAYRRNKQSYRLKIKYYNYRTHKYLGTNYSYAFIIEAHK